MPDEEPSFGTDEEEAFRGAAARQRALDVEDLKDLLSSPGPDEPGGGVPPTALSQTEMAVACFELGARIHDHVGDLLDAVEEMDEAKPGDPLGDRALGIYGELAQKLDTEFGEAMADNCVPEEVGRLYVRVPVHFTDRGELREALYALSVALGDPPLFRNYRRLAAPPARPEQG